VSRGPGAGERVRTIFIGSGRFGLETLRRIGASPDLELVAVVTAPPRPAGRRQQLLATDVAAAADRDAFRSVLTPARLRAPEAIAEVLALQPGLIVLADYGQIVPAALLGVPHGALNLHPSLLPRHRGASPIPAAILAGDAETGVTLMRMDAGLDTGPVVAQVRHGLAGNESAPDLERDLELAAGDLFAANVGPWLRGELTAVPQPDEGATLTRTLRREDGRLDPSLAAADLDRHVRAFQPWPGTFLELADGRLVVTQASVAPPADGDVPGRLVRHGSTPALSTPDGRLVLERVTPPGRKPMTGADWLRGRRDLG